MLDELLDEVKAARRTKAADKRHRERIKELLIRVRLERPNLTVADIEERIGRFYDRATISRITADAVKDHKAAQAES